MRNPEASDSVVDGSREARVEMVREAHKRWELRTPSIHKPYRVMLKGECVGVYKDMGEASDHLNTLSKGAQLFKYMLASKTAAKLYPSSKSDGKNKGKGEGKAKSKVESKKEEESVENGKMILVALSQYAHNNKDRDGWLGSIDTETSGSPDFENVEISEDD